MPSKVLIILLWTLQVAEQTSWQQTLRVLAAEEMELLPRVLH